MRRLIIAVSAFAYLGELRGQDEPLLATVRDLRTAVTADSENDPKFDILSVRFEATLHNSTNKEVRLASEPVILSHVKWLSETGEWKTLFTSSWFDTGTVKYQACTKVKPGADYVIPEIITDVILRKDDKTAHPRVTVRFYFYTLCVEGSGQQSQVFVTVPVDITH